MLILWSYSFILKAQDDQHLSLDSCYSLAVANYPLVKQYDLIAQSEEYSLENVSKGYLPKIGFTGHATYQSEVTSLPVSIPGMEFPTISKKQYRIYGEAVQSLTDMVTLQYQKDYIRANTQAEEINNAVELYKIKDRICQLYFGVLLLDVQINQARLIIDDIENALVAANAAIGNGSGLKSTADILKANLLQNEQKLIELNSGKKTYLKMLSYFTGLPMNEATMLETPAIEITSQEIKRPELKLFEYKRLTFDSQEKILNARNWPQLSLFFQGGYGRPALNMLDNNFKFYYITGLRFKWNLVGLYTLRNDKSMLSLNKKMVDVQQDVFLFNTRLNLSDQNQEVNKLKALMESDKEIVTLRSKIAKTSGKQLKFGVITVHDYLSTLYARDQAEQNFTMHKLQLLMAQYKINITTGN